MQRTIHGEPLEAVDHHKYLEIELSSDLNCWNYRQSQKISFKFRVSEMPSPAFSARHFQGIKTKENAVRPGSDADLFMSRT